MIIEENSIGPEGAKELALKLGDQREPDKTIKKRSILTFLDIGNADNKILVENNAIADDGVAAIVQNITSLRKLILVNNKIGVEGGKAIGRRLAEHPQLVMINLCIDRLFMNREQSDRRRRSHRDRQRIGE